MAISSSAQPYTLFISDEAYTRLQEMARAAGYVNGNTGRGLGEYVDSIMVHRMYDVRPKRVRDEDALRASVNTSPEWQLHTPRARRTLKVRGDTMLLAAAQCLYLGIASHPKLVGGIDVFDEQACLGMLLEAIGTGWVKWE